MKTKGLIAIGIIGIMAWDAAMAVCISPPLGPKAVTPQNYQAVCPGICSNYLHQPSFFAYDPANGWVNNGSFSACPCTC